MKTDNNYKMKCEQYLELLKTIETLESRMYLSEDLQKEIGKRLQQLEKEILSQTQYGSYH